MLQNRIRTFKTTPKADVPTGRHGKHRDIVTQILNGLEDLEKGKALKIPLDELPTQRSISVPLSAALLARKANPWLRLRMMNTFTSGTREGVTAAKPDCSTHARLVQLDQADRIEVQIADKYKRASHQKSLTPARPLSLKERIIAKSLIDMKVEFGLYYRLYGY